MRIRRITTANDFRTCLQSDEPDVLPLWFTDAERELIARTIDPDLSALAAGSEQAFPALAILPGANDLVLVTCSEPETLLARRYATITGRRCVSLRDVLAGPPPQSVTWFCCGTEPDLAGAFVSLYGAFVAEFGGMPRLGVLTADDPARLSWLLVKQLVPLRQACSSTTFVSGELAPQRPPSSLVHIDNAQDIAKVVAAVNGAAGTLLVNAHSRPHCGLLSTAGGVAGICGAPTGGVGGKCVDGTDCHFGEAPKVVLQDLQAERVYFNGCTTAGTGTRRLEFIPREAMVSHAVLRSSAREFVGNVRSGLYSEADLEWFLGASALGYTPAECAAIVNAARVAAGQEVMPSTLYFGDAVQPAWPVTGAAAGEVSRRDERIHVRWPCRDGVLVARVPGKAWADLAARDRLHVRTNDDDVSRLRVSILSDPWNDASIVLVVPRLVRPEEASPAASQPHEIEFSELDTPIDRLIGNVLVPAVENLRWLETLPAFATVLRDASRDIENELVALRRFAASRDDLAMFPEWLAYFRSSEADVASRYDGLIIDEALSRSRARWNWISEYGARVHAIPRKEQSVCPNCGAFAHDIDLVDYANPGVKRMNTACAYCGIVADLPGWPLTVCIVSGTIVHSRNRLCGRVDVVNHDGRSRNVRIGVAVRGAGEMQDESASRAALSLRPAESSRFEFNLVPIKPMSELMQTWVFVASEGAFGFVGLTLLFGRAPS